MIGVYKITNPKGEIYIGQSLNIENRMIQHKQNSSNVRLRESIKKYGFGNHEIEILVECEASELKIKERYYIRKYIKNNVLFNSVYNTTESSYNRIINELLDLSELLQNDFAEKHKIEKSLMNKYLSGKAIPRKSTLDRIAKNEGYVIDEKIIRIK